MPGSEPIFRARHKDSRLANGQPFSVLNGIEQVIEPNSFDGSPTTETGGAGNKHRASSVARIIEFEGDIYWFHRDKVWVLVPGSGWTAGPTTTPGVAGLDTGMNDAQFEYKTLGLYQFLDSNGEQKLCATYVDSSFSRRIGWHIKNSKYTGDGLWGSEVTATGPTVNSLTSNMDNVGGFDYPCQDGSKLYVQFRGGAGGAVANHGLFEAVMLIDMENQTLSDFLRTPQSSLPSNVTSTSGDNVFAVSPATLCAYSGIIWEIYHCGGAGSNLGAGRPYQQPQAIVVERIPQLVPQLDLVLATGLRPNGGPSLGNNTNLDYFVGRDDAFVARPTGSNQDYMYALTFIWGSGQPTHTHTGWACWKLRYDADTDSLINEGDVGWKVLPPALRLNTSSTLDNRARFKAHNLVDISGVLTTILTFSLDAQQTSLENVYEWRGDDTEMRLLNGVVGNASWSHPLIKSGGGEQVWSPRQPYNFTFRVDASGADPGTLKLRTRVLGNGEAIKVRYYFDSKKGPMRQLASISGATSGTISSDELTGVTANSGEFVVTWNVQNQGFDLNDIWNIHPVAEDN